MTTAQTVFDIAMSLMDEVVNGQTDTGDTKEYRDRTLLILNALAGELYPYSDTFEIEEEGKRPIVAMIPDFTSAIGLDDYICRSVMPYGLAAHLLLDENPASAGFFQQRYEELRNKLARGLPSSSDEIVDVYFGNNSGYEFDWIPRW